MTNARRIAAAAVCLLAFAAPAVARADAVQTTDPLGCDSLDPAVCLLPFPNDAFTKPDPSTPTGRRLDLNLLAMPRNIAGKPIDPSDMNNADGFSPGSLIITKIPGLDNPAAFRRSELVPITDMARSFAPRQAVVLINTRTLKRQLIWAELDSNASSDADRTLLIHPAKNLDEGTRYIVALRHLRDAQGHLIAPQPTFRAFRDGTPTPNPADEARRPHFESIFHTLAQAGIQRSDLYLAWDFTVASEHSLTDRMLAIRNDAFRQLGDTNLADLKVQGAAPAFHVTQVTDYTPQQDPQIARQIQGTFDVPCYLSTPACAPVGSHFILNPTTGLPLQIPGNTMVAQFTCRLPRVAAQAPVKPALYGHGLFGSQSEITQGQLSAFAQDWGFGFCATDWSGMSETDIPNVATVLTDLSNFNTLADRVQQGMLNFLYLGRLMIHPQGFDSDPNFQIGGHAAYDTRRLFYDGNSQGGIIGGALTAVAPDFTRAVLGVPGMNYSTLLTRSSDFGDGSPPTLSNPVPSYSWPLYTSYPSQLERPLILALIQLLWDRAEPDGYAAHMTSNPLPDTPAHEVMLHEAFGDHQVANVTTEVEARTIGAKLLRRPMLDPGRSADRIPFYGIPAFSSLPARGSALVVWDSGSPTPPTTNTPPTEGVDPHEHPRNTPAARAMKAAFLSRDSWVIDTCDGGPCYANGYRPPGG